LPKSCGLVLRVLDDPLADALTVATRYAALDRAWPRT
jgi:hypothetical protein